MAEIKKGVAELVLNNYCTNSWKVLMQLMN